jgi:hypothetical protein
MRWFVPVSLLVLALAAVAQPVSAQVSIIERDPMDLGTDQLSALRSVGEDMLYPPHYPDYWMDIGGSFPVGALEDSDLDPGLLLRFSHQFWRRESLGLVGSLGFHFQNDTYFNEAQEEASVIGGDELWRAYIATPATIEVQVAVPQIAGVSPFVSFGPGVVWSHHNLTTSAVNNGVGDADTVLFIGPGGEQGISPYVIETSTHFNLGWAARAGLQFRVSNASHPLYLRLVASGTTYYHHKAPRTLIGAAFSLGR